MSLGDKVRNLVERANNEVDELHFANGAQAAVAHPASGSDNGAFADGRVDHPLPTETFQQAFAGLEGSAVHSDVFPDQHDGGVALHLLEHGLLDGFEKSDRRAIRSAAIRCGSVGLGHGYLRAFLEELAAPAFAAFFPPLLTAALAPGFEPFADFASPAELCAAGGVSPK